MMYMLNIKVFACFKIDFRIKNIFRSPPYKTTFQLKNISKLPCVVTISLHEIAHFNCHPKSLKIAPDMVGEIEVSIKPMRKGTVRSELAIVIKNNPKVHKLFLQAKAVTLEFTISPTMIFFERVSMLAFSCFLFCQRQVFLPTDAFELHSKKNDHFKKSNSHRFVLDFH